MKSDPLLRIFSSVGTFGFFGIGRSNLAIIKALCKRVPAPRIILRYDKEPGEAALRELSGIPVFRTYKGEGAFLDINEDMLILSPSVRRERPELKAAAARGVIITSDAELFFANNKAPLIAVSGSDGKSTTVTLTSRMLGSRCTAVGNIGVPMLPCLWASPEYFVAELSSFMLHYSSPKSLRAAITNITPNHLNWHRDMEEYVNSKLALFRECRGRVVNLDCPMLADYARAHGSYAVISGERSYREIKDYNAEIYLTRGEDGILLNGKPFIGFSDIRRREDYNIMNLMTAIGLCYGIAEDEDIRRTASDFTGLPHRRELFFSKNGVDYYNSSIDTTPQRTLKTLSTLDRVVLILGGRGKGGSYSALEDAIRERVLGASVYGEDRERIFGELRGVRELLTAADSPEEAFLIAARLAKERGAQAVLLSPAATSYDCFSSFEERGDSFKRWVLEHLKD